MVIIETPLFTKLIQDMLPDEDYRLLQQTLLLRPEAGVLIRGGGGLRKIRWNLPGSGKRGGLRIIYYWDVPEETIYMLLLYKKSRQDDLTPAQLKVLRDLVKEGLR
jgi:mRNA-degrading endonuclease RelE of RelBE toxin-antitoxin system